MKLSRLTEKIKDWGVDRNIHSQSAKKQLDKLNEEVMELVAGIYTENEELIKDSIGDVYVVLVMLSMQLNVDIEECIELAYTEIKDRKGKMIKGIFVKDEIQ